ncbi:MAG: hypothetical protein RIR49_1087 [Actinomycetota bacterium]
MENNDLHRWISHRADMLWVCMKTLMLMTVGVTVAIALGGLGDASTAISIAVGAFGFFLWFCAFGAVMDIASMRNDMSDDLRASAFGSQFTKAPFPVYIVLATLVMLGVPVMLIIALNA